ncbi:MAG: hypothetical protein ACK56G_16005 [Pirellulaceae bacterium]
MVPICMAQCGDRVSFFGGGKCRLRSLLLAPILACLAVAVARGQGAANDAQVVSLKGKIEGGQGLVLQVTDDSNAKKLVKLPDMPERILYRAEALLPWLQPGLWVRFATELNAMGQPTAPLSQMEVFTPIPVRSPLPPEQLARRVPGIYPVAALGANGAQPFQDGKNIPQTAKVLVVGQIAGGQKDRIALQCGGIPMQVRVDDKTQITVTLNAIDFVQPGDAIVVQGLASAQSPDEISAQTATITAVKKLGETPEADDPQQEGDEGKGKNKSNRGRAKKGKEPQEPKGKVDRKKEEKEDQEDKGKPSPGDLP